jgi:hypothetical protein
MVFRIKTGKSFPALNNEDYLGILTLAFFEMTKYCHQTSQSTNYKPFMRSFITVAAGSWEIEKEETKKQVLIKIKSAIIECGEKLNKAKINEEERQQKRFKHWQKENK